MLAAKTLCNTAVANLCVGDQVLVSARPPTRGSAAASGSAANSAASATAAASAYRRAQIVRIRVDTTTHAVDLGVAYLDEVALTKAMDLGVSAAVATRDQLAATGATTDESQLVWYPAWSVSVANAPLTVVRNCADLAHRSSFTIADALAAALRLGIIHTKIGFINVSVNPLCQVGPQDQVGPAEEAAVEILRGGDRHHTIIVTGVSGSGKTVYTFEQLEYLCRLASAGVDGDAASSSSTHEVRPDASRDANPVGTALMAVVPLLERLGNARTPFNDNSSRVGNEWKLSFDTASGTLRLVGVCLATNMLESPRVAWQGKGEGNFHIFYDFVGCKEPGFLARYGLENATPDTLVFFCNGLAVSPYGSDPDAAAAGWPKFCQGWQAAGLSLGQLRFLERVIATVLHLGQARSGLVATRASRHGEEVSAFDEVGAHHMGVVEDLCGIEAGTLSSAILHPTRAFGNRDVTAINRTVAEARTAVDALASKIYALAFDWLVAILNDARLSGVGDRSNAPFAPATITIMDQPGFESLEVNNLSQLMINNANQLRAVKLNEYHVRNERMALAGDGATTTLDGVPVVIPDPGVGDTAAYDVVMSLLEAVDDQTKVGRRDAASADATCLDAFFDRLGSQAVGRHGRPAIERVPGTTTSFEVGHFASTVRYTADGMVSMNDGRLERSVLGAVVEATNLSDIRAGIDADGARPTVAQQYKTDLQKHENTIDASKAHFVWCFRPSATQEPGEVDRGYLVRQLDNNGCTRHLEVADAGFPHRIPLRTLHKWLSFVLVPRLVPADARPTFTLPRIQSVIRAEVEAGLLSVIDALHQQESDANDALDGVSNGVSRSSLTPAAVALGNGNAYFKTHAFTALERFSRAVWTRKAQVMGLAVARKLRAIRASESYRVAERRRVEELESRQLNEIAALETRLTTLSSALESAVGDKSAIEAEKAAVVAALREAEAVAAHEREQRAALEHARVELEASLAEHRANQDALAQALAETKSEAERARLEAALQREALLAQREARAVEERRAREAAAQAVTLEAAVCDLEAREAAAQREARRIHDEKAAVEAERDALVRDVAKLKEAPRPGAWRTKVTAAVEVFKTALRDTLVSVSNDPDWIEHVHTETTNAYRALDRRWFTNYGARDCIPLMWEMTVQAVSEGLVANTLARLVDSPDFDDAVAEVIVALLAEQIAKPARFGAEYDACLCTGRGRLRSAMQAFVKSEGTKALKAVVFAGDDPHGVYDVLYERSGSVFKYFSNYGRAKEAIKVTLSSTLATVAMGGGEMMSAALAEKLELVLVRKAGALVSDYVYRHAQWADDDAYADAVSDLEALPSAGSCLAADPAAGVGFVDAQPFGGVGGSSSGSSGEETAKIEMDAIGCLTGLETSVVDHKEIARGVEIGRASVFHPRSVAGAEVGV